MKIILTMFVCLFTLGLKAADNNTRYPATESRIQEWDADPRLWSREKLEDTLQRRGINLHDEAERQGKNYLSNQDLATIVRLTVDKKGARTNQKLDADKSLTSWMSPETVNTLPENQQRPGTAPKNAAPSSSAMPETAPALSSGMPNVVKWGLVAVVLGLICVLLAYFWRRFAKRNEQQDPGPVVPAGPTEVVVEPPTPTVIKVSPRSVRYIPPSRQVPGAQKRKLVEGPIIDAVIVRPK